MYRGIFLADLHIGAMDYEETYDECAYIKDLIKSFTKEGPLDFIIIGGDFFDKQLYGNDPFTSLANKMMIHLVALAKVVRVINGTSSHDSDQYKLFDGLLEEIPQLVDDTIYDFKVVYTASEEELLPGLKVLYLPEEYIVNQSEYYDRFLKKKKEYDYIFGHGVIVDAPPFKHNDNKRGDHTSRKPARFSSEELAYAAKGKTYFGHYHIHSDYCDNTVFYVGSTCRWCHGEEVDKGFFYLETEPLDDEYKETFVINDKALKYVTKSYGYKDDIFTADMNNIENELRGLITRKEKYDIYNLRIIFNIPVDYENPEAFINYIRGWEKSQTGIKCEFKNGYIEEKKRRNAEDISELKDEYKIFLDKNISKAEQISHYIKLKKGVDVSPEEVAEALGLEIERKGELNGKI